MLPLPYQPRDRQTEDNVDVTNVFSVAIFWSGKRNIWAGEIIHWLDFERVLLLPFDIQTETPVFISVFLMLGISRAMTS